MPEKLFVTLKIGHLLPRDPPFALCSKTVRPFCKTSIEMPRRFSEYLAARAQSVVRNPAEAIADVAPRKRPAKSAAVLTDSACRCRRSLTARNRRPRRFWTRTHRQVTLPQFLDVGQFVKSAQAKVIEKKLRCLVEQRAAGNFGAAADFDETAFH